MVKKKPSESPDDKYVGFVKTIGKREIFGDDVWGAADLEKVLA